MENVVDELFLLIILHQNSLHLCQLDLLQKLIKKKRRRPPVFWVKPWLSAPIRLVFWYLLTYPS